MTVKYEMTKNDKDNLLKYYIEGLSLNVMYSITKIPKRQITGFFKKNGLDLVKRYDVIENYFDNIDTSEKSYWLGYMYCDGFVGEGKYNNVVLSSIDENIIDSLISELIESGENCVKKQREPDGQISNFSTNTLYEMRFSNKHMKETLSEYNIVPNRKDRIFLDISVVPEEFRKYTLYGMIDADGSLEDNGVVSLYVTRLISESYIDFVKTLELDFRIKYNKSKRCYYIVFRKSDEYTKTFLEDYHSNSKIDRKRIAPSLS